jgi:AraC-like DNA-binding protein
MFRKIIVLLALGLSIVFLPGAPDSESRIAAARGREKLELILQFLQGFEKAPDAQEQGPLLERYAREALDLSKTFRDRHAEALALRTIAHAESARRQYEPALEDYFHSRRIFDELGDRNAQAAVSKEIADLFSTVFYIFSDYERTREYYKNSLASSRRGKDPVATAKNLADFANTYRAQGNFLEAIPLYREALRLNDRNHVLYDSGAILSDLSDSYLKAGDHAGSMNYLRQALVFYQKKRQTQGLARMYSQKGAASMRQNDFPGALLNFRLALEMHEKYSERGRIATELRNIGTLYSRFKQEAQAREYVGRAQALRRQLDDQIDILGTVLAQAATLQKQNELPGAEALLRFCENQAKQKHLQGRLCETYLQLSTLYSLRHDPVNALYYQTLGRKTQDGLPSTAIQAGMQQIIAKNESDKEIAEINRQKRRQTIIGILGGGLLLVLTGILAWKRKSVKKWVRDHLTSKEQRLQKKKSLLQGMQLKLGELQEKQGRSPGEISLAGDDSCRECLRLVMSKMQNDKIFLDSELTLKKMAAKVGANTSSLSKALNQDLGMGFSDFINYFRIEEAKKIMLADDQNKWDVVDVCYEVGFNSMSSFYRIFKMHTGTTPMEFQRACKR